MEGPVVVILGVAVDNTGVMDSVGGYSVGQVGIMSVGIEAAMVAGWNSIDCLCEIGRPFEDSLLGQSFRVIGMTWDKFAQPLECVINVVTGQC